MILNPPTALSIDDKSRFCDLYGGRFLRVNYAGGPSPVYYAKITGQFRVIRNLGLSLQLTFYILVSGYLTTSRASASIHYGIML